jgi:hypothetical protein
MKASCDFCSSRYPKYKFPNPRIENKFLNLTLEEGYMLACIDCTIMLEDQAYGGLVTKTMEKPEWASIAADTDMRDRAMLELAAIYNRISRMREPF